MAGLVPRLERLRRSESPKKSATRTPMLRLEQVEPRLMLNGAPASLHSAPTVAHAITLNGAGIVTGATASLSVLGSDAGGESSLTYNWSVSSQPAGAAAKFSLNGTNAAKNETVTFNEAGTYTLTVKIVDAGGLSVSTTKSLTVVPTVTSIGVTTNTHQTIGTPLHVAGASQGFIAQALDQFGKAMTLQPMFAWSTTAEPSGAAAPGFSASGANASVTFHEAGSYNLKVTAAGVARTLSVIVDPTATTMSVTPATVSLATGAQQQFTAEIYDQFHNALTTQPTITWTAAGGTITTGGLFTAGSAPGSFTVTAKSGSLTANCAVTVQAPSGGLQNAALAKLLQSLDADGSISRNDMIQILHSVAANGAVTTSELSDLKTILGEATKLNMPGYVQVLAGDVISGNAANATFQGQTLGNLAAGSSATQLNDLVAKWFLGADEPVLSDPSFVYKTAAGSLFPHTPNHSDEFQGELGDCYFISSLGTIADSNPAAIENMIIDNGDGTYTVRFYTGTYGSSYNASTGSWSDGFTNGAGTADYVTVDRKLATTSSGMLVYADFGANYANSANALWIPLLEKAYAEWNQTGKEGRNGQDSFAAIEGGWMATVDAQVLGHNATDYNMTDADKQYAISALAAHEAVTIGTYTANYGLVASHAYAIIGYNSATDTFTLYNPWGSYQPGQLTWTQLEATCDGFVVASTSGSTAITSGIAKPSATVAVATADTLAVGASTEVTTTAMPQNQSNADTLDARGTPLLLAVAESDDNFWLSANEPMWDFGGEGLAARGAIDAIEAAFAGDLFPSGGQIWAALILAV